MSFALALLAVAVATTIAARAILIAASANAAVDHYYWILAARAYRRGGRWPVAIPGKYLLEDERQAYPPLFGWLLSRLPEPWLVSPRIVWLVQTADAATLALIASFAWAHAASTMQIAIIVAVYGLAPVLVAYNTQLTSRAFGNMFLVATFLAEAAAAPLPAGDLHALLLYGVAVIAATGVVLTHKMTTQLMLALWPVWPIALGDWRAAFVPALAIALAAVVTGPRFARLQWLAHVDIVTFWHRHRDELGAHAFAHSPIYGIPSRMGETAFHKPGWRGFLGHAVLAFSYAPLLWLAPLTLLWAVSPPAWIVVWSLGTGAVVLLTLYVPWLRCLGGGHLYVFNAIAPVALWWATVVPEGEPLILAMFGAGLALTVASLALGYRRRSSALSERDEDFQASVTLLSALPAGRIAVFPLTAVEEVAYRTPHAVLWGAHGYGFRRLESIFPIVRSPMSSILREHSCDWLLFDTHYWPAGEAVISSEIPEAQTSRFGDWRLVTLPFGAATRAGGC